MTEWERFICGLRLSMERMRRSFAENEARLADARLDGYEDHLRWMDREARTNIRAEINAQLPGPHDLALHGAKIRVVDP